ncbi:hypothetical protein ABEV55_17380 [Aneurinibacillus thermoaerophilus]|uniref:hypothetical protein n=1 Tax=Aneurinibacillus thermoaerophilus TaxID=143495 RepID=UPI002E22A085|nr:hypothetical protein [Aneurinibacillus thermoaerophilus]
MQSITLDEAREIADRYFNKTKRYYKYLGIAKQYDDKDCYVFVAQFHGRKKRTIRKVKVLKYSGGIL